MSALRELETEYSKLASRMQFQEDTLDYGIVANHIAMLKSVPVFGRSALSIFDNFKKRHIYESDYHKELFKNENGTYTDVRIHPDDLEGVMKNSIAALKHFFMHNINATDFKLIREYRAYAAGAFRRISEQMQFLEFDRFGNPWLTLSIVEISPNQSAPFIVNSKYVNTITGETFNPLDDFYNKDSILTRKETEVLRYIGEGKLSKEISDLMGVSVHTVNTHRQRILAKLGVANSIEALRYARALGVI